MTDDHRELIDAGRELAKQVAAQWERNPYVVLDQRDAALARLAQAERERDEALTERADLEIGLTLCQDDLTRCGTELAAARSALEKYGRHHGACPSRPITLTGDWWLDPPEMGACICGFSVATVGSAPDAG